MIFNYSKETKNKIGIYEIYNSIKNRSYIGQTETSFNQRWKNHKNCLLKKEIKRGDTTNPFLKKDFHSCLADSLSDDFLIFNILDEVKLPENYDRLNKLERQKIIDELDLKEIHWISEFKKLGKEVYNFLDGGHNRTAEDRLKLSENKKGHIHSDETKIKISESKKGKCPVPWNKGLTNPYSKETLVLMSEKSKGRQTNLGKKHSDSTKQKISTNRKGIPAWNKGMPFSQEVKIKMSISAKLRKERPILSEDGRKRISESKKSIKNPSCKSYTVDITSPLGIHFNTITCLAEFCRNNNVIQHQFRNFLFKNKTYPGWIINSPTIINGRINT